MAEPFFQRANHCTRCGKPFVAGAIVFMVREYVAWSADYTMAVGQLQTVAVCEQCASIAEHALERYERDCSGCGRRMSVTQQVSACSDACRQRLIRKKKRGTRPQRSCEVCSIMFRPTRDDVKFCSDQCRQLADQRRNQMA
jgi:predicted nucleic acid-binding Zn ribbon protein